MSPRIGRSLVAGASVLACAVVATVFLRLPAGDTRTEDRNGDGRPDVWRVYDQGHRLSDASFDTNFDGRPDVQEHYQRGELVRRESDRDFNSRIDLVQDFDPGTGELARSVVDVDSDGTADLLVLFQAGRPVFSKWARPDTPTATDDVTSSAAAQPASDGRLTPLKDPFRSDLALRAGLVTGGTDVCDGLSTSIGLLASRRDDVGPLAPSATLLGSNSALPSFVAFTRYAPRGPPVVRLLA